MSFEIRVICEPGDLVRISAALDKAFQTGHFRSVPTRDSHSRRLYVTADHLPEQEQEAWPTPEAAYTSAPNAADELAWLVATAQDKPLLPKLNREFWLRRSALTDRMALGMTAGHVASEANALDAALQLMDLDDVQDRCAPRSYVRQQYALWAKNQ